LAKSLGIENLSASQVSEINKGLNEQVGAFRTRLLEKEYSVLWVDALYEKIRTNERVINMAVLIFTGTNTSGIQEILAVEPVYAESEETYTQLFDKLKGHGGLENGWPLVSDAHKGLQAAVKKCFLSASWQHRKIHFMRNILAHCKRQVNSPYLRKVNFPVLVHGNPSPASYRREVPTEDTMHRPKSKMVTLPPFLVVGTTLHPD
jgi:transposase-like protein